MTRFAPVAPPQLLRSLKEYGDSVLGFYHLLLAHDVVSRPDDYRNLIPKGSVVIMDNSVIELGSPVSAETMKEAISIVPTDVVVLPDVIGDMKATIELSCKTAEQYLDVMPNNGTRPVFMAVPQGSTPYEVQDCAEGLAEINNLGMWGVGRYITQRFGTRRYMVDFLNHTPWLPRCPIHLLGFSDNFRDDMDCAGIDNVRGIDSAVPLRMGQGYNTIRPYQTYHTPRGSWWETETGKLVPDTLANIFLVREWLTHGIPEYTQQPVTPAAAVPDLSLIEIDEAVTKVMSPDSGSDNQAYPPHDDYPI
jgi:hypothetical protein